MNCARAVRALTANMAAWLAAALLVGFVHNADAGALSGAVNLSSTLAEMSATGVVEVKDKDKDKKKKKSGKKSSKKKHKAKHKAKYKDKYKDLLNG